MAASIHLDTDVFSWAAALGIEAKRGGSPYSKCSVVGTCPPVMI